MPEPPSRGWRRWLQRSIGPVILLALLASIDLAKLAEAVSHASLVWLLPSYLVLLPPVILRVQRWRLLLANGQARVPFSPALHAYCYAIFAGTVTPGRLGEFVKVLHAKHYGATTGAALASSILDRVYDVLVLLVAGASSAAIIAMPDGASDAGSSVAGLALAAVGVVFGGIAALSSEASHRVATRIAELAPGKLRTRLDETSSHFFDALRAHDGMSRVLATSLTIVSWAVQYVAMYMVSEALGFGLSYTVVAGISAIGSLVSLLPISVLGAGTRDAALLVLLTGHGVAASEAIAFSIIMLSFSLWVGLMGGLVTLVTPRAVGGSGGATSTDGGGSPT